MRFNASSIKAKSGTGFSQNTNSFDAGVEIANKAVDNSLNNKTLFFLFATPHHKIDLLMNGIRSVIGNSPKFLGCTTTGLVTNNFLSYNGTLAGAHLFHMILLFLKLFMSQLSKTVNMMQAKV